LTAFSKEFISCSGTTAQTGPRQPIF